MPPYRLPLSCRHTPSCSSRVLWRSSLSPRQRWAHKVVSGLFRLIKQCLALLQDGKYFKGQIFSKDYGWTKYSTWLTSKSPEAWTTYTERERDLLWFWHASVRDLCKHKSLDCVDLCMLAFWCSVFLVIAGRFTSVGQRLKGASSLRLQAVRLLSFL